MKVMYQLQREFHLCKKIDTNGSAYFHQHIIWFYPHKSHAFVAQLGCLETYVKVNHFLNFLRDTFEISESIV